ncbi:MAG: histidine kinase [Brachybacterium sp.]
MTQPVTGPYSAGDAGRPGTATGAGRAPAGTRALAQRALGGWVAAALVTILLLVVSVPISSGVDRASTVIAVLLSLAGGLSVRHPVVGAVAAGTVLTLGLGNGPAHIGSGILASPVTVAACAARGHLLTAIGMAAWHVIPLAVSAVLRGDDPEFLISQVMLWLVLQTTAVLAGTWGRSLAWRARAERSRRISDLAEQRRAIARELHDTGVRAMTRVVMLSENATVRPGIEAADAAQFSRIAATAREAAEELRVLLDTLRTEDSAGIRLPTAGEQSGPVRLRSLVEGLRLRLIAEGFHAQVSLDGDGNLPVPRHGVLDRCLREIEANVIRHGDRCVPVAILGELSTPEPDHDGGRPRLDLLVRNGVAPRLTSAPRGGAGLEGMRERLAQIGGQLETRREGALFLTHLTAACTLGEGEQDQDQDPDQDVTDA